MPGRIQGTVEQAMAHAEQFMVPEMHVIAATVGTPDSFGLPPGWVLIDVAKGGRGWSTAINSFPSAREAITYELRKRVAKPLCFRVMRRSDSISQVVLSPTDGRPRRPSG